MSHFDLPHHHGNMSRAEKLHRELSENNRFDVACEYFKLFSDATRIRIFWLLSHQETCVINIAAMLNMSSPAVSHHLRALTEGGLIESRRDGKEVYYRCADTEKNRLLHEIIEQVLGVSCPEQVDTTQDSPEEVACTVHSYLMEHLNERIKIEELSRQFLINTTTLKQAFKTVYGTSIGAHMKVHRMERAAKLLRETNDSIALIAKRVGYESQSRFTAAFKEIYNIRPTEYRKQNR